MGKKTHGVALIHAIEANEHAKVHEILAVQVRVKAKIQQLCTSKIKKFPNSELTQCPIISASLLDDPEIIKYMVAKHEVNINHVNKEVLGGKAKLSTPLIEAVRRGLFLTAHGILSLNADCNIQDHNGRTALHHAVRKANYRMAKMILARGANANINDSNGNSPLLIATKLGHVELVKLLLHYNGDYYKKGPHGAIPLHVAAREGHIPLIRLFVNQGVNVNIRVPCYEGMREKTPLHVACEQGHFEAALVLVEQCGAEVNISDSEGETPLTCTVIDEFDPFGMKSKDDYTETAKLLLQCGAEPNIQNLRGESALHLATRNEFQQIVELLIQAGVDPQLKDNDGNKAIDLVSDDDAVTKNYLKRANDEREQLVSELLEIDTRGFSTSRPNLRSQSNLNMSMIRSSSILSHASSMSAIQAHKRNSYGHLYEDGYLLPMDSRRLSGLSGRSSMVSDNLQIRPISQSEFSDTTSLQSATYAIIDDKALEPSPSQQQPVQVMFGGKLKQKKKSSELRRSKESQLAMDAASDSSLNEEPIDRRPFPKRSQSVDMLVQKHSQQPDSDTVSLASQQTATDTSSVWKSTPKLSAASLIASQKNVSPRSDSSGGIKPLSPKTKRRLLEESLAKSPQADTISITSQSTIQSDSTITGQYIVNVTTPKAQRAATAPKPQQSTPVLTSFTPTAQKKSPKDHNVVSDSDGTFFDDESFDSMSETDDNPDKKNSQAGMFIRGNRSTVRMQNEDSPPKVAEQKPNIAKVSKENPKLGKWLIEQAELSHERGKDNQKPEIATKPTPAARKPSEDDLMANLPTDDDASLVDHIKPPMLIAKSKLEKPKPETMKPIPASRTDSPKKLNTNQGEKPKVPTKPMLPPRDRRLSSGSDSTLNKPPPPKPETKAPGIILTKPNDQLKNFNVPENAKDTLKGKVVNTPEKNGQRLHWEKDQEENGLYWEHTGTEKIYEGIKNRSFDKGEAPSKDIRGSNVLLAPKAEVEDLTDIASSVGQSSIDSSSDDDEEDEEFEVPNSCHLIAFWYDPKFIKNHVNNLQVSPRHQSTGSSTSSYRTTLGSTSTVIHQPISKTPEKKSGPTQAQNTQPPTLNNNAPKPIAAVNNENQLKQNIPSSPAKKNIERVEVGAKNGKDGVEYTVVAKKPNAHIESEAELKRTASLSLVINQIPPPEVPQKSPNMHTQTREDDMESNGTFDTFDSFDSDPEEEATTQAPPPGTPPIKKSTTEPGNHGPYEEIPYDAIHGSPNKKVTIGGQQVYHEEGKDKWPAREVSFVKEGKLKFSLVGGNVEGVYVHNIMPESDAERQGLMPGDKVLKVNGQSVAGKTKEEATMMLMSLQNTITMLVKHREDLYVGIVSNGGLGDSFYVKVMYNFRAKEKGEIDLYEGEILSVRDTLPEGKLGSWNVLKMNPKAGEKQHGLIPNQQRAEQFIISEQMKKALSFEKEQKGGFLRRSLRRSKSADRLNTKEKEKDNKPAPLPLSKDLKTYIWVEQKSSDFIRPVVLLGLFGDNVCNRLARESPGLFDIPAMPIELPPVDGSTEVRLELNYIHQCINERKHSLMLLSPRAIKAMQEKQLQPIVIYMSPGNKSILKAVRNELAPAFKARTSFMMEEAMTFQKQFGHLFTATVTYTTDGSWLTLLRDTISRFQNQAIWQQVIRPAPEDVEAATESPERNVQGFTRPRLNSLPRTDNRTGLQRAITRHQSASSAAVLDPPPPAGPNHKLNLTYDGHYSVPDPVDKLGDDRGNPSPVSSNGSSQGPRSILKKKNGHNNGDTMREQTEYANTVPRAAPMQNVSIQQAQMMALQEQQRGRSRAPKQYGNPQPPRQQMPRYTQRTETNL